MNENNRVTSITCFEAECTKKGTRTPHKINESDRMVDQMERAEVAEEKRSVFRALTRLRGAAITSFDGVARSQTGNIDEYNKVHKWRTTLVEH